MLGDSSEKVPAWTRERERSKMSHPDESLQSDLFVLSDQTQLENIQSVEVWHQRRVSLSLERGDTVTLLDRIRYTW